MDGVRVGVLVILAGCSVDAPDKSFGMITAGAPMTASAGMPTSGGDDSGSGDDGSGDDGADDGSADDGGSGSGSSGDAGGSTASDTGSMGGMQPADGVYSACASAAECAGAVYCVPMGDGFCTVACAAPTDCPAPPTAATPTVCIPITMPAASVCALDCSGGQTCPAPMECTAVEGAMVCV